MRFMIKTLTLFFVLVISTLKLATYSFAAPEIVSVQPSATIVEKFAPIFMDITISADYDNPFDPEDIKVDALIETEGKKLTVPGFYLGGDKNDSKWQIRFTPMKTGEYSYVVKVTSRSGEVSSRSYKFKVVDSERDGFLRINPVCNYTFIFDSGKPFRGIGLNFGWEASEHRPWEDKKFTYEFMFAEMNRRGANFIRTWMCPWNLPLEWNKYGLNRYDLEVAERLDEVIRLAEKYGIYLILVLDYYGVLRAEPDIWGAHDDWWRNPYNAKLGGPAKTPREFLSNPEAREIYKKRLRYIVARWGYSPHIASWQFWNEIQHTTIRDGELIKEWHREMSDYMRQIDVHRHLLSTSSDDLWGVWELDNLDFSQSHKYGSLVASTFKDVIEEYQSKYNKPHIIGEFSYRGLKDEEHQLEAAELHHGLWRGLFSATPVLPLTWWWECHYKHGDYKYFTAVNNFSGQIDYSQPITPLAEYPKIYITKVDAIEDIEEDFVVHALKGWGTNSDKIFTVDETGAVKNRGLVPQYLFGSTKKEQRNPPVFEVEFKKDGEFAVHVYRVSAQNTLRIWLDDEIALEQFLPLGPGEGEWESSEYKPQWELYQGVYNKSFSIPVKAGRRRIKVENVPREGDDWINITKYVFRGLGIRKTPEIMGLKAGEDMFLWFPNPSYNAAYIRREQGMPRALKDMVLVVEGMNPGKYVVQLFDTTEGIFFEEIEILLDEKTDGFRVNLPAIQKSIACKISFKGAF